MRDSDWDGVCGVPGIGKSLKINKNPNLNSNEEKIEQTDKANLKEIFFKMFQSRRSKIKLEKHKNRPTPSFTFPKCKVIKYDTNPQKTTPKPVRIPAFCDQNQRKLDVKRIKSQPLPKSTQKSDYARTLKSLEKLTISVATQTEPEYDHRKLRRIGTAESKDIETWRLIQGVSFSGRTSSKHTSDIYSESGETIFDQSCDLEVFEALTRGCSALQNAIQYKRRAEVYFESASDVISPTEVMETDMDTDTDDSDVDVESVNFYEEVLNCESYIHRETTINSFAWNEPREHKNTFHQNSCFLPRNNKTDEKKKLIRTSNSNPAYEDILGQAQYGERSDRKKSHGEDALGTKFQGLKKTLSEKLSIFHSKKLYDFEK